MSFIDWYRGLACILMFQTHAYDAWMREPYRQGGFWELARMQLGGFPARVFLFLAGVSLMLRYSADARRGVSEWQAQRGGMKRGAEVLLYGLLFRLGAWIFGGATRDGARHLFKVDILNCIGVSLVLCSLLVGPRHLKSWRPPIVALLLIPVLVLVAPLLQALPYPRFLPAPLCAYLWDANPMGSFPLFPWLAYALTGCIVGGYWMRCVERRCLGKAMLVTAVVGALLMLAGQIVPALGYYIYFPTPAVPMPAYPISYVYRTGGCFVLAALSYAFCLKVPAPRFSPLRLLGQASLLVYLVHIELVYGFVSWPIRQRLAPIPATVLIVLLTVLMVALAYFRVEVYGRRKKAAPRPA